MHRISSFVSAVVAIALLPGLVIPAYAGDILRGGAPLNSSRRTASPGAGSGVDTANQARTNARDRLARTTQLTDAMRAMQQAARNAAARPGIRIPDPNRPGKFLPRVPDGLRPGGLQVAPGVPTRLQKPRKGEDPTLWTGANLPVESRGKGGVAVTIKQTEQQALLNWETFNVGKKTTLHFDQTAGGRDASKWIAFNKVSDPSGRPSQILGKMKAKGQVYVINQNGIIFGGGSQVNVHALTAAALPINENLITRGLLDNPTSEFLFDYQRTENFLGLLSAASPSVTFREILDPTTVPKISVSVRQSAVVTNFDLVPGTDYTLSVGRDRRTTLTLTPEGIAKAFPSGDGISTEQFSARFGADTGDVIVARGAQLLSPTSAANVGGRIALIGANVRNRGTIETPDGQTILAAGLQVGFTAHDREDPSLRGLDVAIGAVKDPSSPTAVSVGGVLNAGLIDVPRGNVTMAGANVRQNGVVDSSTSVSLNGRIDLQAVFDSVPNTVFDPASTTQKAFVPQSTGLVTFGDGSVTRILPELGSSAKAIGESLTLPSQVEVRGRSVYLGKDSILLAPNAQVNMAAGKWLFTAPSNPAAPPISEFVYTGGRIYADRGALIDVSGTAEALAPLEENILTLQFRGAEFSDAPVQRDGLLRATDLTLDIRKSGTFDGRKWVGTPLGDATKYAGLIERTVGELTMAGGTVSLNAGESVVLQRDATVDVSGGYVRYGEGFVETSRVMRGGQIIDIADATPDQIYDGLYTAKFTQAHNKWGIQRTYGHPLALSGRHFEESYLAGSAGGAISIQAPAMALDGRLTGATVVGPRQLRDSSGQTDLPGASRLNLKFEGQHIVENAAGIRAMPFSPARPTITIDDLMPPVAVGEFDPGESLRNLRRRFVALSPDLMNRDGFGALTINNAEGKIVVGSGVKIETPPGGSLDLKAANIDVRGSIVLPGGAISLTAYNLSPYRLQELTSLIGTPDAPLRLPAARPDRGVVSARDGAVLSTAGLIVDDRFSALDALTRPLAGEGGKVGITAYSAKLASGSLIDVSGGVEVDQVGRIHYGDAGAISILAGRESQSGAEALAGGRLELGGELRGFSGAKGGSLALQAMRVRIGESENSNRNLFTVTPDFFNRGGFSRFSLTGIASPIDAPKIPADDISPDAEPSPDPLYAPGLVIDRGVVIRPRVQSWVAQAVGGANGGVDLSTRVLPEGLRSPVSLGFEAKGAKDLFSGLLVSRGDLQLRPDASIQAGPLGGVTLKGDTVAVFGSIEAVGGSIALTGAASFPLLDRVAENAQTTLYLGAASRLSTAGAVLRTPDPFGHRTGRVLDGGSIALAGNIVAEPGSLFDVSGATGVLDFTPAQVSLSAPVVPVTSGLNAPLFSRTVVPVRVDSDGGHITLDGSQMLVAESTLRGAAGGPAARGGTLSLSSGRFYLPEELATPVDVELVVRQSGSILKKFVREEPDATAGGRLVRATRGVGESVVKGNGETLRGRGYFSLDRFSEGGFDSLDLGGIVKFAGPVDLTARGRISVATGEVNDDGTATGGGVLVVDDDVTLRAPYVALGTVFSAPLQPDAQGLENVFGGGGAPFYFGLQHGRGRLTVEADLIDVGNLAVRGVRLTKLVADHGDIRGQGVLAVPGKLRIRAGQIYPVSGGQFTLAAYDYRISNGSPGDEPSSADDQKIQPGSIVITGSGDRALPLSAGGELNLFASDITQNGVLRAPLGAINIGWDGTGDERLGTIVGKLDETGAPHAARLPITQNLVLGSGSETSVSAVDRVTGQDLRIPYGLITNGDSWIDPSGIDITVGGAPSKSIQLSAANLKFNGGAKIDISGGGDLYAFRWVDGQGGTQDILSWNLQGAWVSGTKYQKADLVTYGGSYWYARADFEDKTPAEQQALVTAPEAGSYWQKFTPRFAVIPGYQPNYAPFAAFNSSAAAAANLGNTTGYVSNLLSVGDRVHLGASPGLPEGDYTLLPARYALLPGAVLVTPQTGDPMGTLAMPDGSNLVSGYAFNALDATRPVSPIASRFEVARGPVVAGRVKYEGFSANRFLRQSARKVGAEIPRLPVDAGHLVFEAQEGLRLNGSVRSLPATGGIGAMMDVSSPLAVLITDSENAPNRPPEDTLVLDAGRLSSFGAESLFIGGRRVAGEDGTTLSVQTESITLQNKRSALAGPEIILASTNALTLAPGARIEQTGSMVGPAEKLLVNGDGLLLRVSGRDHAPVERSGLTGSATPTMTIGADAVIAGASITLDSSAATFLSANVRLRGENVALNSGRISLRLNGSDDLPDDAGLVLGGSLLRDLSKARSLSLLSYSSIDIYGSGRLAIDGELALHAVEIRGFGAGDVEFSAATIALDNAGLGVRSGQSTAPAGRLTFEADTIELGGGRLDINQYATVNLNADRGVRFTRAGRLGVQNDLTVRAPVFVGDDSARGVVRAGGAVRLLAGKSDVDPAFTPGLGAEVSFQGSSVTAESTLLFPSGLVTLRATDGDVKVDGRIDVGGTVRNFFDRTIATSGGQVTLAADNGSVNVTKRGGISVAAPAEGGNGGALVVRTPRGDFDLAGTLSGEGGKDGKSGSFFLDIRRAAKLTSLNDALDEASFFERRSFRVREGDVVLGGTTAARRFDLAADQGSITVTGRVDASGQTGGDIRLQAFGDIDLKRGSELTVAAEDFNAAGKGGSILLEAGAEVDGLVGPGTLRIRNGSRLDLTVDAIDAQSAGLGRFGGILHLRAPRTAGNEDVNIAAIEGTIRGASHVIVEGYKLYELTGALGTISTALRTLMRNEGIAFAGDAGATTAAYSAMLSRLLGDGNRNLDPILSIRPGVELINRAGDLTLGAQNSGANNDWNFADWRFGPKSAPGVLTLRASGDLTFFNALQDGFKITNPALAYLAPLMEANPLLPANAQSWSFRLTAGADFSAANFAQVQALQRLEEAKGSIRLGKFVARGGTSSSTGANATTLSAVTGSTASIFSMQPSTPTRFQVIRTGSGDIDVNAGRDVQLLNQFATIYTAGTLIDPTRGGTFAFDVPINSSTGTPSATGQLGSVQQNPAYPVQYSMAGGDVTITAGNDIAHYLRAADGTLTDDSSRELPMNWLYRRGAVDPTTGEFSASFRQEIASTTWWVDFANFFEGVGALGGGNVSLIAGRDVKNVDGLVPTNLRTAKGRAATAEAIELGGGDLLVRAGRDINGGVYYVERGRGTLEAGHDILTNGTRSPSSTILTNSGPLPEPTWLPTTLFVGKGSFDVSARGDVLLGPVSNPFLLPAGYNNGYWYKSFFTTYAPSTAVNVTSLGGSVTLRQAATLPSSSAPLPLLFTWLRDVSSFGATSSGLQPWLKLNETLVDSFRGVVGLLPATLRASALSGDINLVGDLTLTAAPRGTLDLVAANSINALQVNGFNPTLGASTWSSSRIIVSDANPAALPRANAPFSYQAGSLASMRASGLDFLQFIDVQFEETGSVDTVLQTKQTLHTPGLHADDPDPVRLYAKNGDISGLTFFAPKAARLLAGNDITDIALYAQNLASDDVTTVAAGRDIVAYHANSPLRSAALANGNILAGGQGPQPGDIQLSGPGVLQVLAGRNVDLGTGASNNDGTAVGVTTIGNRRNPYLPFDGAGILVAAGLGPVSGLVESRIDFARFVEEVASTPEGKLLLAEAIGLSPQAGELAPEDLLESFLAAPSDVPGGILLKAFSYVLRDAGRDHENADSPNYKKSSAYAPGYAAVDALFGAGRFKGDISARGRNIRTVNGGKIDILAPGGELTLAPNVIGDPEIPPGIITEAGGEISIFTHGDVDIGVGRIFTLRGGNQIIWSSAGNIAAGSASKTVASAPPTRALIDPQSADVQTDLAGLSTGGGIGVLATVAGVPPGFVDLIAPVGAIDAGDAGIRATGAVNVAAERVLNADNITAPKTTGVPVAAPSTAPNLAGLTSANTTAGATNSAANSVADQARKQSSAEETPSTITVEVLGYGGGDESASLAPAGDGA